MARGKKHNRSTKKTANKLAKYIGKNITGKTKKSQHYKIGSVGGGETCNGTIPYAIEPEIRVPGLIIPSKKVLLREPNRS